MHLGEVSTYLSSDDFNGVVVAWGSMKSAATLMSFDGWFMGLVICKHKKREQTMLVKQESHVPNKN